MCPFRQLGIVVCVFASMLSRADEARYPDLGVSLAEGKGLWIENCEGCHGYGIAGAPIPMRTADWKPRVAKDRDELYQHAINGFFGPEDTYMPPRGGNDALTDEQVVAAVDYMIALALHFINRQTHSMEQEK